MANNTVFKIDDGTKEFAIENEFGEEICKIHLRAGDISIFGKYNDFVKSYPEMIAPLSDIDMDTNGESSIEADWDKIKKVESVIIEKMNKLFGSRDIGNFFKDRNAFSTIDGVFYLEKVITLLGQIVSEGIKAEVSKSENRMKPYKKNKPKPKQQEAPAEKDDAE